MIGGQATPTARGRAAGCYTLGIGIEVGTKGLGWHGTGQSATNQGYRHGVDQFGFDIQAMREFWGAGLRRIKADAQAWGCNERFGLAERCVTVVAGLCLAREKQVNLRVIPMSTPSPSRSDWRMNFPIACFGGSGANSQALGCPLAATGPDAIPQGRSSDFARAIARLLPRSSPCVRDSRRLDRGRSCRG